MVRVTVVRRIVTVSPAAQVTRIDNEELAAINPNPADSPSPHRTPKWPITRPPHNIPVRHWSSASSKSAATGTRHPGTTSSPSSVSATVSTRTSVGER